MIPKEITIFEILQLYPDAYEVFESFGMGCGECMAVKDVSLEKGARRHNVNLDLLLQELNNLEKNI